MEGAGSALFPPRQRRGTLITATVTVALGLPCMLPRYTWSAAALLEDSALHMSLLAPHPRSPVTLVHLGPGPGRVPTLQSPYRPSWCPWAAPWARGLWVSIVIDLLPAGHFVGAWKSQEPPERGSSMATAGSPKSPCPSQGHQCISTGCWKLLQQCWLTSGAVVHGSVTGRGGE